jgi:hypothetical protein
MGKPSDYNHGGSSDISSNKKAKPNTTVDLTHSLDLIVVLETDDSVSTQHEPDDFLNISDDETQQPIGTNATTCHMPPLLVVPKRWHTIKMKTRVTQILSRW